jgi:hypothetical protein
MSDHFKFRIYLPTLEKYVYFKELTSKDHLVFIKTLQNVDHNITLKYFRDLILKLCDNAVNYNELTRIDIFCILLNIRIICVSSLLKLKFKCEKTDKVYNIELDLYDILDRVTNYDYQYTDEVTINDDLQIQLKVPIELKYSDLQSTILDCIDRIILFDNIHELQEYNTDQRKTIIDNLPGDVFNEITRVVDEKHKSYDIEIFEQKNPHNEDEKPIKHTLNLYSDSFYQFIRLIYDENLNNIYQVRYILGKQLGMSATYLETITQSEVEIYLKLLEKEIHDQKKAAEKASKQSTDGYDIPGMMPTKT